MNFKNLITIAAALNLLLANNVYSMQPLDTDPIDYACAHDSIHWDWKKIDTGTLYGVSRALPLTQVFKNNAQRIAQLDEQRNPAQNQWLWGTATSAHQVDGGHTNNNWYLFEGKTLDGKIVQPAAAGVDALNHIDDDIANMKALGTNAYRFSVEWSELIPQPCIINHVYLSKVKELCQKLVANNIKPCVTLYHYTEPIWFAQKGSFIPSQSGLPKKAALKKKKTYKTL